MISPQCFKSTPIISMQLMPVEHVKTRGETLQKPLKIIIWLSKRTKSGRFPQMEVEKLECAIWTIFWKADQLEWTANRTLLKKITLISLMVQVKHLKSSTRLTIISKDKTYLRALRRIQLRSNIQRDILYLTALRLSSTMRVKSWWVVSFRTDTISISLYLVLVEQCNSIVRIQWTMGRLKDKTKTILIMKALITWSAITMTL